MATFGRISHNAVAQMKKKYMYGIIKTLIWEIYSH